MGPGKIHDNQFLAEQCHACVLVYASVLVRRFLCLFLSPLSHLYGSSAPVSRVKLRAAPHGASYIEQIMDTDLSHL